MTVPPRRTGSRGQASVELALLLPVIVLLVLVILQIGLLARDAVLVTHAAREGARAAAVDDDAGAARAAALASGDLDPDRTRVEVTGRGDAGSRVRVEVVYRAPTRVPLVGALLGDRTLRASVTMRVESAAPQVRVPQLVARSRSAPSRARAAALSRCSLPLPHLGDWMHDGHPSWHGHTSMLSWVAARWRSAASKASSATPAPPGMAS